MRAIFATLGGTLLGSGLGAFGLCAGTVGLDWLFFRGAVESGQYGWSFIVTFPLGAALGAVTGLALVLRWQGQAAAAGWLSLFAGVMGAVVMPSAWGPYPRPYLFAQFAPLLWAGGLAVAGYCVLRRVATQPTKGVGLRRR